MNEINNQNSNSNMPNMNVMKGLLAVIFGLMFIVFAAKIILNIIFFIAGIGLIYYGLRVLDMRQATEYLDKIFEKVRNIFPS